MENKEELKQWLNGHEFKYRKITKLIRDDLSNEDLEKEIHDKLLETALSINNEFTGDKDIDTLIKSANEYVERKYLIANIHLK